MLKTILLVVPENDPEHAAVKLAMRWAKEFDALLVALGLVDETRVHPLEAVPLGAGQAKRELDANRLVRMRREIEGSLSTLALRCAEQQVAFKPLEDFGRPTADILLESQRFDLIVMPRHGHYFHASTENGLGTALWEVVRATPRPVLAVPDQATVGESVLVAYDGSLQAARALQAFQASGLAANRQVHVVALNEDHGEAARCGDRAVEYLANHDIHAVLHADTCEPRTSERLIQYAYRLDAGLIVMGAYGRPMVLECVMGSVTRALLGHCTIPLFLYH
jgi:nucleotide-binding universal stress UspA family protein